MNTDERKSNVWVVFPTANTAAANATLNKWHERGYRSVVLIDQDQETPNAHHAISLHQPDYPGFTRAANALCHAAINDGADLIVVAGDDIDPDPDHAASDIAAMFYRRFPDGFGVLQPTGDAYGALEPGNPFPACVSPWIGREFIETAYAGRGPYWPEYPSFFGDTELWCVAEKLGVLWTEPSLTQFHRHNSRGFPDQLAPEKRQRIRDGAEADKALFLQRRAAAFPGALSET